MGNNPSQEDYEDEPVIANPEEEERKKKKQALVVADSAKLVALNDKAIAITQQTIEEASKGVTTEAFALSRLALRKVPDGVFTLTHLKRLDLSFNRLQAIPSEIGNLTNLTWFDFSHNHIHFEYNPRKADSELPISAVANLEKLEHLNLSWNLIPSVRCITKLTALTYLDVHHNYLTSLPELSNKKSLNFLDVSECNLTVLPELSSLPLRELLVRKNQLKELPKLPTSIKRVHVPYNMILSVAGVFSGCMELEDVDLRSNFLEEAENNFSDFVQLPNLTRLSLSPNKMRSFPPILCAISTLTSLDVGGLEVHSLPDSVSSLTNLKRLALRYNRFKEVPSVLYNLTGLTALDLAGNEITAVGPEIAILSALRYLNLTSNKLKELPVELGNIPTLTYLYVDENPLADPELLKLANSNDVPKLMSAIAGTTEVRPSTNNEELATTPLPRTKRVRYPSQQATIPANTTLSRDVLRDKILGLFFGAAIGDALGLATEFLNLQQSSFQYGREKVDFDRSIFAPDQHRTRWVPGDWTDDTDQMILILENLLDNNNGSVNEREFALALLKWSYGGFPEMGDGGGMGLGQTVSRVLQHRTFLDDPHASAQDVWEKNGRNLAANGAVMRTAILGVPFFQDIPKVIENTLAICKVTHYDARCQASCIAVTVAIALMLQGETDVEAITNKALEHALPVITEEKHKEELRQHVRYGIKELNLHDRPTIGYTYKTMGSGFYAFRENEFVAPLMRVMWESGDADTNAAVAGAMLGCKLGYSGLPKRWVDGLVHKDWLQNKMEDFLEMLGLSSAQ